MNLRVLVAWFGLLLLAIGNGGFRDSLLAPRLGPGTAHILSCFSLSLLILVATWLLFPWLRLSRPSDAVQAGALWLCLTLAFEFLAGHFLFHKPWSLLLADYNIAAGRLWLLVLVATFAAPPLAFAAHHAFSKRHRHLPGAV